MCFQFFWGTCQHSGQYRVEAWRGIQPLHGQNGIEFCPIQVGVQSPVGIRVAGSGTTPDGEEGVLGEEVLKFWVGRFIDFSFIEPQEVDPVTGFVITPSESYSDEILDPTRISWITTSEKRYLAPMMTLASTEGYPSSLQTTNYLGVNSFLTLVLDTEGFNNTENTRLVKYKITTTSNELK